MKSGFDKGMALMIGVGNDLPQTVTDAEGFFKVLSQTEKGGYKPEFIDLVTGPDATREGILNAFDGLIAKSQEHYDLIIYYSGHGGYLKDSDEFYLVPYDYDHSNIQETWISSSELMDKLNALNVRKMFIIFDCCHARGMSLVEDSETEPEEAPPPKFARPERLIQRIGSRNRAFVLSSCRDNEKSYIRKQDQYSLFTQCLIEAMEVSEDVTPEEKGLIDVLNHIYEQVPIRSKDLQHPYINKLEGAEDSYFLPSFFKEKRKELDAKIETEINAEDFDKKLEEIQGRIENLKGWINSLKEKKDQLSKKLDGFSNERETIVAKIKLRKEQKRAKEILDANKDD